MFITLVLLKFTHIIYQGGVNLNNYYPNQLYKGNNTYYRASTNNQNNFDDRSLLLPFLVGAAVAFPIGYIASNTNKNQYYNQPYNYPYPQYQQYLYYPQYPYQQPYYPY